RATPFQYIAAWISGLAATKDCIWRMKLGRTLGEGKATLPHSAMKTGGAPCVLAKLRTGPKIHDGLTYDEFLTWPDLPSHELEPSVARTSNSLSTGQYWPARPSEKAQ